MPLINRCAIEPDFYVRDMLTWALIRLPRETVLPLALAELESPIPQARSQAIHTLTKLNAYEHWQSILPSHLHDPDHEVARAAWRAAAMLTPFEHADRLTAELITELGRGDFEVQRSLSRALVELGETSETKVEAVASSAESSAAVRAHAVATLRLIVDPESTFVIGVGG